MPTPTTLPTPEGVLQDVIRAFNESTSVDRGGKKDYVDVIFRVYQKHLEGKTPEQQKKILQGLIEALQGRSTFQNVGLGIRNPLAAFKISRIISAPNAPQWIKDIGNMSYDNASDGATQLYNTIHKHKQIDAISTPNGSIAINSIAYNNLVANHPADEKAPSLLDRIKAFFSNIFTSIKDMFVAKDPELITPSPEMTLQQKLATEKELLLGRLGALSVNEIKCNIKSEKKDLLAMELIKRVKVLKKAVNNEDPGIDRIKQDIADLEQDVAKLKEPNLNQQDIKTLLSEYLPEPQSNSTPAGPKKATMLPSIGAKAKSMETSAKSFAKNVSGLLRKTGNKKPQD